MNENASEPDYDVAILGGGPAGSTAAALLARAGRHVVVFERERFPRFHIGESLLPRSMKTLARSGALPKIENAGFIKKFGAEIASGCGASESKFYFRDGFRPESESAFQVPRAAFDKLLLDHAAECGAEVREETPVESVDFLPDRACLTLSRGTSPVSSRYVLDCTGRNSFLAKKFSSKRPYSGLDKIAIYAHYENVTRPAGIDGTLTRMIRSKDRWFWMIPLTDTKMSVGVVMDSQTFREAKSTPEALLSKSIAALPLMAERMIGSSLATPVYASSDYSYSNDVLSGPRWLTAGDAGGFIDPVFSSGVFLAILGAEQAADAIDAALTDPRCASKRFDLHARKLKTVIALYLRFVRAWYRQEFIETVLSPREFFGVVPAVNAVLAGNTGAEFSLRWRLLLFQAVVTVQRFVPLCPRLSLQP